MTTTLLPAPISKTAPDNGHPTDPTAGPTSRGRMNSYCRIEVASANPVPTEAYPTARTARGDLRSSCTPDRLRKVAIGHHHRGIGPIVAGAMLTPHQKP
jgi:hypothetical protein